MIALDRRTPSLSDIPKTVPGTGCHYCYCRTSDGSCDGPIAIVVMVPTLLYRSVALFLRRDLRSCPVAVWAIREHCPTVREHCRYNPETIRSPSDITDARSFPIDTVIVTGGSDGSGGIAVIRLKQRHVVVAVVPCCHENRPWISPCFSSSLSAWS